MTVTRIILFSLFGFYIALPAGDSFADIYRYKDEEGVWHFTNIKSDARYKLFIKTYAKKPDKYINDFGWIIDRASREFGIEHSLIKAIIKTISSRPFILPT